MPIKQHLTKYDMLAYKVRKLALKSASLKNGRVHDLNSFYSPEEKNTITKAVIIASFASGHSWQTNKCMTTSDLARMNSAEIKSESHEAATSKWKMISNLDISEVAKLNIPDSAFSTWAYFHVERSNYDEYKKTWTEFKNEFKDNCEYDDGMERKQAKSFMQK